MPDVNGNLKNMALELPSLFLSESMSDVVLCVGDPSKPIRFPAHKFVLSLASPVFLKMFGGNFMERNAAEVHLTDLDPDAFKSVLSFLYTRKILYQTSSQIINVLYIADKYLFSNLIFQQCIDHLSANVNCDNFYNIHEAVKLFSLKKKPGSGKLMRKLWELLSENTDKLLQYTSFATLDSQDVKNIITRDSLNVSCENVILEALMRWAEQQCFNQSLPLTMENKLKVIGPMFYSIRFSHLKLQEFQKEFGCMELLKKDKLQELMNIVDDVDDVNWQTLETKKVQVLRGSKYLLQNLRLSDEMHNNSCSYQTLLIAVSRELVVTEFEFLPDTAFESHSIQIRIANLRDKELCNVDCPVLKSVETVGFRVGCRPMDVKCCVPVGDVYLKAKTTYKFHTVVKNGGLYCGVGVESGMRKIVVDDEDLKVVFKVLRAKIVTLEEVDKDGEWCQLLSYLDGTKMNEENANFSTGVIRSITFVA